MSSKKAIAPRSSRSRKKGDRMTFEDAVKNRTPWAIKGQKSLNIYVPSVGNFAQRYTKIDSTKDNNYNNEMKSEDKLKLLLINDEKISPQEAELLAKEFLMAVRGQPSQPQAENLSLPDHAPGIYAEREIRPDLGRKENPIEFLQRVWGRYMDAGVLYQDDIKRLGDEKLVQAVRSYCQREGLVASDHLPPPSHIRTDHLVASLDQSALAAAKKLAERERSAIRRSARNLKNLGR